MKQLAVSEIFGPTFQGEGPSTGRQAVFLRMAMCNLKCVWCDTKYTWDWTQYSKADQVEIMTDSQISNRLTELDPYSHALLVVTGGEPMLQQDNLSYVIGPQLRKVEIETNGTIEPRIFGTGITYNVSPKLANSGNDLNKRYNFDALRIYNRTNSRFKFVCATPADVLEVGGIVKACNLDPAKIWIMPEGNTREQQERNLQAIWQTVLSSGWNLTMRMHVQIWNGERGR